jgi:hypothetical protein
MDSKAKAAPSKGLHRNCWIRPRSEQILAATLIAVSQQEAKITLAEASDLPPRFDLLLTRDGKVGRCVEVLWKSGNEMGLRFVSRGIPPLTEAEREPDEDELAIREVVVV